ncbi:MAG: biotin/lipoate--protein ligase family protein [Alphaproteobacteria bacterium]|nr:biotin/lipoate--protein ligase family protein [Alphaproteobacteria bacterium]
MTWIEPTFPPLLSGRVVIKGDDPEALAIEGAGSGELGAGDVLWLQDADAAHLAIVLEPDVALRTAAQMLPLAVAAAGDRLSSLTPPQVGVQFRWPATLLLNGAEAGACTLTASSCTAGDVPRWMVVSFWLRMTFDEAAEPGNTPGLTSLGEEGGEELTITDVLDSFSRHFLSNLDSWQNDGLSSIAATWSNRVEGRSEPVMVNHPGTIISATVRGLDEDGNLLVAPADRGHTIALPLLDCVAMDMHPTATSDGPP